VRIVGLERRGEIGQQQCAVAWLGSGCGWMPPSTAAPPPS
jgi:hypothetical protein